MTNDTSVIAMLGTAIASLFSFVIWLYRSTLDRAYKRIEVLEGREQTALQGVLENLKELVKMSAAISEALKEIKRSIDEPRRGGGR
jgi:hypothetical protein